METAVSSMSPCSKDRNSSAITTAGKKTFVVNTDSRRITWGIHLERLINDFLIFIGEKNKFNTTPYSI